VVSRNTRPLPIEDDAAILETTKRVFA
jgi:hypothetical protein